jgi:signal transduction histidine kinase
MFLPGRIPRFLTRLGAPADHDERRRIERVLASARVFLACAGMLAIYLDPTEPTRFSTLAFSLLFGYIVYSISLWALLHRFQELVSSFPWMHAVDMAFPAVFTLFTEGPNSPFFLFFVFVVTAAALRWGFVETTLTSLTVSLFMVLEAALLKYGKHLGTWLEGEYELNRFVIRLSYFIILGMLLGYLAEEQKQLRAENAFVSRLIGEARVEAGLRRSLQAVLGRIMRLFLSPRALAVVQQNNSGRVFVWHVEAQTGAENTISGAEAAIDERNLYFPPLPAHSFYAQRRGTGWTTWALDSDGRRQRLDPGWSPAVCPEMKSAETVLAVGITLGEEWSGHLLLFEARTGADRLKEVRFAQKLCAQISPAIYTVYLLRRLRSRAGAVERARVARELHDGAIQALIAVEMEVDVLKRETARSPDPGALAPRLERIQELLREQVFDLRTLMQQMRPLDVSPRQLLDHLADTVDRFRRDTGIRAEFVSGLDEVELPPRLCRELVRIAQEALANIRKHSGARRVLVRFGVHDAKWTLAVEDDGRGFEFAGRKSLAELDACRKGPQVIKERVRTLGGDLEIESLPGQGTRLEITFPQRAQAAYV